MQLNSRGVFREENRDTENKVGRQFRPLYDIPYMFEAREFLRKRLIGKKVQVCGSHLVMNRDKCSHIDKLLLRVEFVWAQNCDKC